MVTGRVESAIDRRRAATGRDRLSVDKILAWADAYYWMHRSWPVWRGMPLPRDVPGAPGESWRAIDAALAMGLRGLPGHSSLAELLAERRAGALSRRTQMRAAREPAGPGNSRGPMPPIETACESVVAGDRLSIEQILTWADAHHRATGNWPNAGSGTVRHAGFRVTWAAIDGRLRRGRGGLPGGGTLSGLLADNRQVRSRLVEPLSPETVLAWADAHFATWGQWPRAGTGPVAAAPYRITWSMVNYDLRKGKRGLPGRSSLSQFLHEHGREQRFRPGRRSGRASGLEQILAWADAHHAATGWWPSSACGRSPADPNGVNWTSLAVAVQAGRCGFPKGTALWRVLAEHDRTARRLLSVDQILAWADAHHAASGGWPISTSGRIAGTVDESWNRVDVALRRGARGLRWGSSLSRLLDEHGRRKKHARGPRKPRP
jgi:hypothetical protein